MVAIGEHRVGGQRATEQLELTDLAVRVGDRAVQRASRVAQQVARLAGRPLEPQQQVAEDEVRLDRADARRAIGAERSDQGDMMTREPLTAQAREAGCRRLEFVPDHSSFSSRCIHAASIAG